MSKCPFMAVTMYKHIFKFGDSISRGVDPVLKVGGGDGGPIYIDMYV